MPSNNITTLHRVKATKEDDRRTKFRFPVQQDLRYKIRKDGGKVESGVGQTIDLSSGGVAFSTDRELPVGVAIELSIGWPVLLSDECAIRLLMFGKVVRNAGGTCACTADKWEFRTQGRVAPQTRNDRGITPIRPR